VEHFLRVELQDAHERLQQLHVDALLIALDAGEGGHADVGLLRYGVEGELTCVSSFADSGTNHRGMVTRRGFGHVSPRVKVCARSLLTLKSLSRRSGKRRC